MITPDMFDKQLVLELPDPKIPFAPRLGEREVRGGMFKKNLDTGEVREKPDYSRFDEFPG